MTALSLTFRAVGPAREHSLASPTDATPVVEVRWDSCALPALLAVTVKMDGNYHHEMRRPLPGWTQEARSALAQGAAAMLRTGHHVREQHADRFFVRACEAYGRMTGGERSAHRASVWCQAWSEETACLREGLETVRDAGLAVVLRDLGVLAYRRTALTSDDAQRGNPTDTAVVDWAPAGLVWACRWVRDRGLGRGYAEALEALSAQTELARAAQRLACELGPAVRAWTHKRDQDAARELLMDALDPVMRRAGIDAAPTQGSLL